MAHATAIGISQASYFLKSCGNRPAPIAILYMPADLRDLSLNGIGKWRLESFDCWFAPFQSSPKGVALLTVAEAFYLLDPDESEALCDIPIFATTPSAAPSFIPNYDSILQRYVVLHHSNVRPPKSCAEPFRKPTCQS